MVISSKSFSPWTFLGGGGLKIGQASVRCLMDLMAPQGQESVPTAPVVWRTEVFSPHTVVGRFRLARLRAGVAWRFSLDGVWV